MADPDNYQRYLRSRADLDWWEAEGRARARR